MDLSKFKTSDWMKIGGAIGFFIFGFFSWVTVDGPAGFGSADAGGNVFDFFWTGTLPWLLVIATGVITFLLVQGVMKSGTVPWPLIMLVATGLAALLLLIRLIFNPLDGSDQLEAAGFSFGRGIGMILSVISGLVAFAGAFIGFKESGGDFNDLKDMNKLKASFQGGGSSESAPPPPPPPPPGMAPPPPPPPPA
ncbi:MAG TPA: hypothetical protein VHQ23_07480 [Ilumatobacteraceae bacterium]|nr:hypothetical protein [Ilumatobacteraceae bacterium]